MITAPEMRRTAPDRLRLVGAVCGRCSEIMFPARMVCPHCGTRAPAKIEQENIKNSIPPPLAEEDSFLFATAARRVSQEIGND